MLALWAGREPESWRSARGCDGTRENVCRVWTGLTTKFKPKKSHVFVYRKNYTNCEPNNPNNTVHEIRRNNDSAQATRTRFHWLSYFWGKILEGVHHRRVRRFLKTFILLLMCKYSSNAGTPYSWRAYRWPSYPPLKLRLPGWTGSPRRRQAAAAAAAAVSRRRCSWCLVVGKAGGGSLVCFPGARW